MDSNRLLAFVVSKVGTEEEMRVASVIFDKTTQERGKEG
jgi:hypothetical protein